VIHRLSRKILNISMYMLGCKVALEHDLSIGAIFRRKTYLDVPVILSTGPNGTQLSLILLLNLVHVYFKTYVTPSEHTSQCAHWISSVHTGYPVTQ
jgi:hypothetical protein